MDKDISSSVARSYRRLLVPFDGTEPSLRALAEATQLARGCGAQIRLVAAFDAARHVSGFEPARCMLEEIIPQARREFTQCVESARARVAAAGVPADSIVLDGDPLDLPAIVNTQAQAFDADMIVVGTHARTGLDRLLLGSVAEGILRMASLPVLLVRANVD